MRRLVGRGWALLLAASACTRPGDSDHAAILVQPVEPDHLLALQERLRIGSDETDEARQLHLVRGAALTETGEIVVLDRGNFRVAVFDDEGAFVREFGGRGDGPGEFRDATSLAYMRDTVLVGDSGSRIHTFLFSGHHVATRVLREPGSETDVVGEPTATRDGWVVPLVGYFDGRGSPNPPRPTVRLFDFHADGRGLGDPSGLEWSEERKGTWVNNFFWVEAPFVARAMWTVDGLGRFHLATTDEYAVSTYDLDGRRLRTMRNTVPRAPVTEELLSQWKKWNRCEAGSVECSSAATQAALAQPIPEFRPVIGGLRGFRDGHIAVLRADLDPRPFEEGDPRVWDLFDADGQFLGSVRGMLTPLWFDGARLVAVERNELGVETVVRYDVVDW